MNEVSCIFWHILILTEINDEDLEHLGFLFIAKGWSTSRNIPGTFLEKGFMCIERHIYLFLIYFFLPNYVIFVFAWSKSSLND